MTNASAIQGTGRVRPMDGDCLPETAIRLLTTTTEADADTLRQVAVTLSHELRTPLTTIYTGSKLLSRSAGRSSDAVIREVSSAIEIDAERLLRVIEDLVVAAALPDEPAVVGEPLLLQRLAPVIARAELADSDANLVLRIPEGLPPVRGDAAFVAQALRNLLANAKAFGRAGGEIVVEAVTRGDRVEVHVLDRGAGVRPVDVPRLFRMFSRTGTDRQLGGLGLGLFVCRRLVELMGGEVWYRPRGRSGSEFGFALPVYPIDD